MGHFFRRTKNPIKDERNDPGFTITHQKFCDVVGGSGDRSPLDIGDRQKEGDIRRLCKRRRNHRRTCSPAKDTVWTFLSKIQLSNREGSSIRVEESNAKRLARSEENLVAFREKSKNTYVSMRCKVLDCQGNIPTFLPSVRLAKNLRTRKGSRRGNTANRLELLVLVHLHHVP